MVVMFNRILKTVEKRNVEDSYLLGMQCCTNWQKAESLSMLLWAPETLKKVLLSILSPTRKETNYSDQTRDLFIILSKKFNTLLSPLL
jgi:hypothetical protein